MQLEDRYRAIGSSQKESIHPTLFKKLDFESNLTDCAHMFAGEPDTKEALEQLLVSVAEFYIRPRLYLRACPRRHFLVLQQQALP